VVPAATSLDPVFDHPSIHPFTALDDREHARDRLAFLVLANVAVVGHRLVACPMIARTTSPFATRRSSLFAVAQTVRRHAPIDLALLEGHAVLGRSSTHTRSFSLMTRATTSGSSRSAYRSKHASCSSFM
jgi:hypothetical protein